MNLLGVNFALAENYVFYRYGEWHPRGQNHATGDGVTAKGVVPDAALG